MRLKELRKRRDLSLSQVAKAVGTTPENIQRWENGIEEPSDSYVEKLADYFQCSISYLKGNSSPKIVHEEKKKKSCLVPILIFILIIVGVVVLFVKCFDSMNDKNNSKTNLLERKATVQDISITDEYDFPTSIALQIIPKEDIDGLVLTIEYYDSSNSLLKTQTKAIGNVQAGVPETTSINLTDFSLSQIWKIDHCKYYVSAGTVSLVD